MCICAGYISPLINAKSISDIFKIDRECVLTAGRKVLISKWNMSSDFLVSLLLNGGACEKFRAVNGCRCAFKMYKCLKARMKRVKISKNTLMPFKWIFYFYDGFGVETNAKVRRRRRRPCGVGNYGLAKASVILVWSTSRRMFKMIRYYGCSK